MVRTLPSSKKNAPTGASREKITKSLLQEFGSLRGVPGFYENDYGKWTFAGACGILIPLFDHENNLYRLRIRLDHPEIDENGKEKNKYNNFSSYRKIITQEKFIKNTYHNGCRIFVIAYGSDKYVNKAVLLYEKRLSSVILS